MSLRALVADLVSTSAAAPAGATITVSAIITAHARFLAPSFAQGLVDLAHLDIGWHVSQETKVWKNPLDDVAGNIWQALPWRPG